MNEFAELASRVMAECIVSNGGKNLAHYLAKALHDTALEHHDKGWNAALETALAAIPNPDPIHAMRVLEAISALKIPEQEA